MTFEDYKANTGVNWSSLKHLKRSPLHYQHALKHPMKDTPRLALGRAVHTATFEPDRFLVEYVCWKKGDRRSKAYKEFAAQHKGETILKLDEYKSCLAVRDAVRSHAVAAEYLALGLGERTITWTEPGAGVRCKGRFDFVSQSKPAIVDLKTTGDVDAGRFAATAGRMGYFTQLAWYRDGYGHATGTVLPAVIIAVEITPPHDVAVYKIDEDSLYAGTCEYQELLRRLVQCREQDAWPGRYPDEQALAMPRYMLDDEGDSDITGLGLSIGSSEESNNGQDF